MADDQSGDGNPDLTRGIALSEIPDGGMRVGHVGDEQVLLARRGGKVFAVGAHCTHYHAPLVEGLIVDDTVRCPWHHAGRCQCNERTLAFGRVFPKPAATRRRERATRRARPRVSV
jgi:phenylpropionate dioxygenase-like ring-hydroxylating dioxygenase large terminal subunit